MNELRKRRNNKGVAIIEIVLILANFGGARSYLS